MTLQLGKRPNADSEILHQIVAAVAQKEGCDPVDLPPLYDNIDPDALDRLGHKSNVKISFEYAGYDVSVEGGSETPVTVR
jgi:hypothetical protein